MSVESITIQDERFDDRLEALEESLNDDGEPISVAESFAYDVEGAFGDEESLEAVLFEDMDVRPFSPASTATDDISFEGLKPLSPAPVKPVAAKEASGKARPQFERWSYKDIIAQEARGSKAPAKTAVRSAKTVEVKKPKNLERKSRFGRIVSALGRAATKVNEAHYAFTATVISKVPGVSSKQEIMERDRARQEKYGKSENDSLMTRSRKLLARNVFRAMAWAPTVAMGVAGTSPLWRPFVGDILADVPTGTTVAAAAETPSIPHVSRAWEAAVVVMPLTPENNATGSHGIDLAIPATHPSSLDVPAPAGAIATPEPTPHQNPTPADVPTPARKPVVPKHSNPVSESPSPRRSRGPNSNQLPHKGNTPSGSQEVVHFVTGGATDTDSQMLMGTLVNNGMLPQGAKAIPTVSPKEMGPFVGAMPTDQSVDLTKKALMDNVRAELARNPNAQIVFDNFSEGNMGGNAVANELLKEGIKVKVNAYGNPESAIGMQQKSSANDPIVKPIMDNLGIVEVPDVPGTVNIFDGDDMWATSGGDGGLTTLGKAFKIPTNHRVVDTVHETPIQTFRIGTEIYKNYGTKPVAIPPNATDITGDPGPEFHKFRPDAAANNIDGAPRPDMLPPQPIPDGQPLPPAQNGPTPQPEHSLVPSFPGEAACVAPDGSNYFTPGNAPC